LALRYENDGADELVFYDITASSEQRSLDLDWIERISSSLSIPFCVAGGIRTVEIARRALNLGADKVSINSPALERPDLIGELAREFGRQCVVVSVDSRRMEDGSTAVFIYSGDPEKTRVSARSTQDWLREIEDRGAGEVVLNCMNQDGTGAGYDLAQLTMAREILSIPLVASGGARSVEHFAEVFRETDVDAALAASVFHRGILSVPRLKTRLRELDIEVRP
jgi:cyclase